MLFPRKSIRVFFASSGRLGFLIVDEIDLAHPDVAVTHRVAVVLKAEVAVRGADVEFALPLHDDAIVDLGDPGLPGDGALVVLLLTLDDDVVGLPFARLATCVHHWRELTVESGGLAVGVGGC